MIRVRRIMGNAATALKEFGGAAVGGNVYKNDSNWKEAMGLFTDLDAIDIEGNTLPFNKYLGHVLLVTNVASK